MVFSAALALATISHMPNRNLLLTLSYKEFDKNLSNGWHVYSAEKKYRESAMLIQEYVYSHPKLSKIEVNSLYFHMGQMLILADNSKKAVEAFKKAIVEESGNKFEEHNAYVKATIAFIEGDRPTLEEQIKILEKKQQQDKLHKSLYLETVNMMKHHLYHKYDTIYPAIKHDLGISG